MYIVAMDCSWGIMVAKYFCCVLRRFAMHQKMMRITITDDMTANAIQMRLMALSAGWHRSCTMIDSTSVMTEQFVRLSMIGNASNTLVPAAKTRARERREKKSQNEEGSRRRRRLSIDTSSSGFFLRLFFFETELVCSSRPNADCVLRAKRGV